MHKSSASQLPSATPSDGASPAEKAKAKYDKITSEISKPIPNGAPRKPPPLLILDLNNTLIFRPKWVPGSKRLPPVIRPHLGEFCDYIFGTHILDGKEYQNWEVIIWSSAMLKNVLGMCQALGIEKRYGTLKFKAVDQKGSVADLDLVERFSQSMSIKDSKRTVLAIWDRSMMNLSSEDFNKKVQTTKDLTQVWAKLRWTNPYGGDKEAWGPQNTVIIDDSPAKLSLQPFNLCEIKEYIGEHKDDALLKMIDSLKRLRNESNIAAFLKNGGLRNGGEKGRGCRQGTVGREGKSGAPAG